MKIYRVTNGAESANFSKAVIDELKRLGMIRPMGSTTIREGVRVYHYKPLRTIEAKPGRGKW